MSNQETATELEQPAGSVNAPAQPGDLLVIAPHEVGGHEQLAEIIGVLGEGIHTHYRVRWEDGRESIFFLGPDATIRRAQTHHRP